MRESRGMSERGFQEVLRPRGGSDRDECSVRNGLCRSRGETSAAVATEEQLTCPALVCTSGNLENRLAHRIIQIKR